MKKWSGAVLIVILILTISFCFVGCEKKKDFVDVVSITFTTNGETITLYSQFKRQAVHGSDVQVSESEFSTAQNKSSGSPYEYKRMTKAMSRDKVYSEEYRESIKGVGDTYYYSVDGLSSRRYYKYVFNGYSYYFVSVKVIDNTTIVIKKSSPKESETTYTVTSFSITYFDEE